MASEKADDFDDSSGAIQKLDSDAQPPSGLFISSISKDEPVVTRAELWAYYCVQHIFPPSLADLFS
jgi:hypothetical protein